MHEFGTGGREPGRGAAETDPSVIFDPLHVPRTVTWVAYQSPSSRVAPGTAFHRTPSTGIATTLQEGGPTRRLPPRQSCTWRPWALSIR